MLLKVHLHFQHESNRKWDEFLNIILFSRLLSVAAKADEATVVALNALYYIYKYTKNITAVAVDMEIGQNKNDL